jgi:two-component system, LytTR family, sensor kinase
LAETGCSFFSECGESCRNLPPLPMNSPHDQSRSRKWFVGFLFWTLIGLSFASQFYLSSLKMGRPITWLQAIAWSLGDWYVWAVLSVPILGLARRFQLEGRVWKQHLVIHLCCSAIVALVYVTARAAIGVWQSQLAGAPMGFFGTFKPLLFKSFHFNLLVYWVIVSVSHAFDYYRQSRERALEASELERSLTQAKLHSLQMQLNPHFLFNTLHAISVLMHRDVDAADRMIMHLSELLRSALDHSETHEVTLRQELEFLRRYLEIEQTRFGDRLTVSMNVEPESLDALVPNLLLQPLVENAIQHGIEPHAKGGCIEISAKRVLNQLVLRVTDNGGGLTSNWTEGVGLGNTRSRLQQLYGNNHEFSLTNGTSGGVTVSATIPFRTP